MQGIVSPWADTFETLLDSVKESVVLVSPYITSGPVSTVIARLNQKIPIPRVHLLTNLSTDNLLWGSTDASALHRLSLALAEARIWHLPSLHAKVYIADDTLAVVTSANLTDGGLIRNYEYGVEVREPSVVKGVREDLEEYSRLGTLVSTEELFELASISADLRGRQTNLLRTTTRRLQAEFKVRLEASNEFLRHLRARPGESTNSIFSRTILYVLHQHPLSTVEINDRIKRFHPDLCDDSIDRVIGGVHFGKRWKHMVRNAQQHLREQGKIELRQGRWGLA